ncbi:MAG TPA: hypothetical protein VLU73_14865 [Methylococcaceae bacterium]|nr:hypothetical protein [Methylococcaceae bacterium]
MIFRLTQKLGKKIGVEPTTCLPPASNPFIDWTANLFGVQRVQYIIATNTQSLYSIVMFGRGITDDNLFLKRALSSIRELIEDDGNAFLYQRLIAPHTGKISFSKTRDKRVLGSINELVFQATYHLETGEESPFETSRRLNNTPMSYIEHRRPKEAFRSMHVAEESVSGDCAYFDEAGH